MPASPFLDVHKVQFGLTVSRTTTGVVTSATCRFCQTFGREDRDAEDGRKRSRTIKTYSKFNTQMSQQYRKHVNGAHPIKWAEYETKTVEEKAVFFDVVVTFAETMFRHTESLVELRLIIRKDVVDNIIADMILDENRQNYRETTLTWFRKPFVAAAGEEDMYCVLIKNQKQFDWTIQSVALGLSFSQVSDMVTVAKKTVSASDLGTLEEKKVSLYVRSVTGLNYTAISTILHNAWAFAIAFDCSKNLTTTFCDVRVRFFFDGDIHDYHLILLPLIDAETGLNVFTSVCGVLDVMCANWRSRLVGVTTDGAANMTGVHNGAITLFMNDVGPNCYRIWCILHQIALPVKAALEGINNGNWLRQLTPIISHLRRQFTLHAVMGTVCPKIAITRWLSMGAVTAWFCNHRLAIAQHFDAPEWATFDAKPTKIWWILTCAVRIITIPICLTTTRLQGRRLLMRQQMSELNSLCAELMTMAGVVGPLTIAAIQELEDNNLQYSGYAVARESIQTFIEELPAFAAAMFLELEEDQKLLVITNIGYFLLRVISGIMDSEPIRGPANHALFDNAPPVLPQELASLKPIDFHAYVIQQEVRLLASWTAEKINRLENQHLEMRAAYLRDGVMKNALDALPEHIDFSAAWSTQNLSVRFDVLMEFAGGLACPFPTTATTESDFSLMNDARDEGNSSLQDLGLEGKLQCKQYAALMQLYSDL